MGSLMENKNLNFLLGGEGSVPDFVKSVRSDLEKYIFNENHKVNNQAKQVILGMFAKVEDLVNQLHVDNTNLLTKVDLLKNNVQSNLPLPMSYAEVAKSVMNIPENKKKEFKLIIKPRNDNECIDSDQVKRTLIRELDSEKDNLRIKGIKKLKDKAVVLELDNSMDLDVVKNKLGESAKLSTIVPGRIRPRIIVYDVQKNIPDDSFIQNMVNKNLKELGDKDEVCREVKVLFKMKATGKYRDNSRNNVVISVSGRIYKQLISQGRIFIGFDSYRVQEFVSVARCFKCQGYRHTSVVCKRDSEVCGYCAETGHSYKDCKNKEGPPCCVNCKMRKKDDKHEANSKQCQEYVRSLEMFKSKIDYE